VPANKMARPLMSSSTRRLTDSEICVDNMTAISLRLPVDITPANHRFPPVLRQTMTVTSSGPTMHVGAESPPRLTRST
jgi:hypothetical protein